MKINCIIIDDEKLARVLLKDYIEKIPYLDLKGEYKNPIDSLDYLQNESIDLMFLDIQMPDLTGIEFLKSLPSSPVVIFTTAYPEYAIEGYQFEVVDYLLKPFSFDRFMQATNKAQKLINLKKKNDVSENNKDYIVIKSDHRIYRLKYKDILYIEGLKEYVSFFTTDNQRIITLQSLKNLEEKLPSDQFLRIHKSYIVALDKIKSMEGNQVKINDKKIPVGKNYRNQVMEKLFN